MSTNRFGFSGLSKSKYQVAYNEELLVDKQTGEYLVKTTDGDVVSYDYSTRFNLAHDKLQNIASSKCKYGDIYTLTDSNTQFPLIVYPSNYVYKDMIVFDKPLKQFILFIDLTSLVKSTGISTDEKDTFIDLVINVKYSDGSISEDIEFHERNSILNSKIIDLTNSKLYPELNPDKNISGFIIKSIDVTNKVYNYDTDSEYVDDQLRHIVHSVLLLTII